MTVTVDIDEKNKECKVSVLDDFTIYTAEQIKEELNQVSEQSERFVLDLSNVQEIDSSAVQILLIWQQYLSDLNKSLMLTTLNNTVEKIFVDYGICSFFNIGEEHE